MWTDDVSLAADAAQLAVNYLRSAQHEGDEMDDPRAAALYLEQAEGEFERSAQFMARARMAVQHAS
jgi:hypothetical protein